jgi:hypothetical protein
MKAAILNISGDAGLLRSRSLVLESAGYQPISASKLGDIVQACKQHEFAAVVICHSTGTEIKHRLMLTTRSCCQEGTPIISLYLGVPEECAGADVAVAAADGPEALLNALRSRIAPLSLGQAA